MNLRFRHFFKLKNENVEPNINNSLKKRKMLIKGPPSFVFVNLVSVLTTPEIELPWHTSMIVAVEASQSITVKVGADGRCLIRPIAAVVCTVTEVRLRDAKVVAALEPEKNHHNIIYLYLFNKKCLGNDYNSLTYSLDSICRQGTLEGSRFHQTNLYSLGLHRNGSTLLYSDPIYIGTCRSYT